MSLSRELADAMSSRRVWSAAGIVRISVGCGVLLTLWQDAPAFTAVSDPGTLRVPWSFGLPPLGEDVAWALLVAAAILAILFLAGYRTRWAGGFLCVCLTMLLLSDRQLYSNHLYLLALEVGLLSLADSGRSLGFDGWRTDGAADESGSAGTVVVWPLWLLMGQVSLVYLFAALAKLNPEYLSGAVLGSLLAGHLDGLAAVAGWATGLALASGLVVLVEAGLAVALWSRRYRAGAALVGGSLHLGMLLLVLDPGIAAFAFATVGVYPLFLTRREGARRLRS